MFLDQPQPATGQDRRRRRAAVLVVVVVVVLSVLRGPTIAGASNPSVPQPAGFDFGVQPYNEPGTAARSAFDFNLAAGQTIADKVAILNPAGQAKHFFLYGADAFNAEVGGGFALGRRLDPITDAGAWIKLPVSEYTVRGATKTIIPIQVSVPPDASPGDHTAGVVAEEVLPSAQITNGHGFQTVHRVVARVYVRVAGPVRPALSVQNFSVKPGLPVIPHVTGRGSVKVIFTVANTGNVRIRLDKVAVRLTGLFGRSLAQSSLVRPPAGEAQITPLPDVLLPGGKLLLSRSLPVPAIDDVTVHVSVTGESSQGGTPVRTGRNRNFWAIPWLPLGVVLAVVIGAVWRRRAGQSPTTSGPGGRPAAPVDDTAQVAVRS